MLAIAAMTVIMAAITIINVTAPGLTSPLTWRMAPTPQALAPAIGVRLRASQLGPRRVGIVLSGAGQAQFGGEDEEHRVGP